MRQYSSAHTLRGPTAERKKSRTNWKNLMKEPNPAKQDKAEEKRQRRRNRNVINAYREILGRREAAAPTFRDIWLYGMPSVRQDFKK